VKAFNKRGLRQVIIFGREDRIPKTVQDRSKIAIHHLQKVA